MMRNINNRLDKLHEQMADTGSYIPIIHRDKETGEHSIKDVYFPRIKLSPKRIAAIREMVENTLWALTCDVPQRDIRDFE